MEHNQKKKKEKEKKRKPLMQTLTYLMDEMTKMSKVGCKRSLPRNLGEKEAKKWDQKEKRQKMRA